MSVSAHFRMAVQFHGGGKHAKLAPILLSSFGITSQPVPAMVDTVIFTQLLTPHPRNLMSSIFIEIGLDHVRCPAHGSDGTLHAASDQRVVFTDAVAINHSDEPALQT
jgi:hypothetical protein